jgi:hypothetical protein
MTEKQGVATPNQMSASSLHPRRNLVLCRSSLLLPPLDLAPDPPDDLRVGAVLPVGPDDDIQIARRLDVKVVGQLHGLLRRLLQRRLQALLLRVRARRGLVQLLQLLNHLVSVDAELLEPLSFSLEEGDDLQRETYDLRLRQTHVLVDLHPMKGRIDIPLVAS